MPESFGARLRQRREQQGIALVTIAEQTKIKLSLLEALEQDDVRHWPSGIFRRAFVRAYAVAIGLSPDDTVAEFLELYPDPVDVADEAIAMVSQATGIPAGGGPPTRLHYLVGSAINSLSRLRRMPSGEPTAVPEASGARTPPRPVAPLVDPLPVSPQQSEPDLVDTAVDVESPCAAVDVVSASEAVSSAPAIAAPITPAPVAPAPVAPEPVVPAPEPVVPAPEPVMAAPAPVVPAPAPIAPVVPEPDLMAAANLCTELARVEDTMELRPLLRQAAAILDATGLIVWVWDGIAGGLRPVLAHGYSEKVLAQLPIVKREDENATAAAFRSAQARAIAGSDRDPGALVVPLLTPPGCAGVLAIEMRHGGAPTRTVRAVATIFAAHLAQLIGDAHSEQTRQTPEVIVPPVGAFATPPLRVNVRR